MKGIIRIFLWCFFAILFVIFFVMNMFNDIEEAQDRVRNYLESSDYYFRGSIIDDYYFSGKYYRCIIVKPDSIYLGKISKTGYTAAYNKELNEVAFLTGYSTYDKSGEFLPSYIIVNSKKDTIIYDKSESDPIRRLSPINVSLTKERFDEVLFKRGGNWIKF